MNKKIPKEKYIFIIIVVVIFLIFFSFWMVFYVNKNEANFLLKNKNNVLKLSKEEKIRIIYKKDQADFVADYFKAKKNGNLDSEEIQKLEDKIFSMIVPKENKDFHFKLFLTLEEMKNALSQGNDIVFKKAQEEFENLIS